MRTESRIAPSAPFEIEALPPIEGKTCTVIFYENVSERQEKEDGEPYYTYDRYTLETPYREGLAEAINADKESWLNRAIAAEGAEQPETLQEQVERLQSENEALADQNTALTSQVTDLQMALCDVYELIS